LKIAGNLNWQDIDMEERKTTTAAESAADSGRAPTAEVGLSLGSNLGDRLACLCRARDAICALSGICLRAQSPVYETEPVGVRPAYRELAYLNAVLILDSDRVPEELAEALHAIESRLGRVRTADRFSPRVIDIDLLYVGDVCSERNDLTLPHPRWAERRFVVQPLADVRPDLILPGSGRRVRNILATLPPHPTVRPFPTAGSDWSPNRDAMDSRPA
jgi:2-amino-4-hydroxy-6-hydroxymethyldihydropteridine diphosphokinase